MPRRKSQSADLSIDLPQPPAAADLPTAKAASETPENQSNAAPRRTSAIEGRKRRPIWKTLDQIEAERRRGSHTSNASSNSSSMPNDYVAIGMTSADVGQEAYIEVESYMRVIDKEQEEADLRKVKEELETRYVSLANAGRRFFRKQDYHQALKYFRAAIQYSKGVEEERQLPLFRYMGKCFMAVNNIKMAIKAHQRELLLATNLEDISLTGRAYGNIGHALRSGRNFNSAIQAFNKQHDICKMIKDREGQMAALENLGRSFHEVATAWVEKKDGNLSKEYYQQALDRYKQCLKLAVKLRNKPMIGRAYGGIGVVHEQMEEYKQAIAAYKKRLSVAQQLQDTAAQGRALCNMGNVYRALDKTDKALVCYRQDLEIGERLGDTIGMAVTCSNLGHLHQSLGQVDPTIQFLERHVALVTGAAYTHGMIYGLRGLAKVYQAVGRFQDAQACFSKLLALAEELKQTELSKKVLSAMATLEEQMEAGVKISPQEASAALMASAQTESGGMQKKTTRRSPRRKGRRTAPSDQTYSTYSDEGALYSQSSVSHMTQTMELQRLAATQEAQDDDEGHVFEETTAEGEEVDDIGPLRRPGTAGSTRSYVSPKSMRRRLESANDKEAVPGRSARPVGGPPSVHRNRSMFRHISTSSLSSDEDRYRRPSALPVQSTSPRRPSGPDSPSGLNITSRVRRRVSNLFGRRQVDLFVPSEARATVGDDEQFAAGDENEFGFSEAMLDINALQMMLASLPGSESNRRQSVMIEETNFDMIDNDFLGEPELELVPEDDDEYDGDDAAAAASSKSNGGQEPTPLKAEEQEAADVAVQIGPEEVHAHNEANGEHASNSQDDGAAPGECEEQEGGDWFNRLLRTSSRRREGIKSVALDVHDLNSARNSSHMDNSDSESVVMRRRESSEVGSVGDRRRSSRLSVVLDDMDEHVGENC